MAPYPDRLSAGSPYPLGATWDGLGTNFAVFSAHAERIDLCLFDPSGKRQIQAFYIMDLPSMDAALEWANRLPTYGCVEVRELLQF